MDAILTEKIKIRLGITGTFHDTLIDSYADDVKAFMRSSGVADSIIGDEKSIGCIARGVADLWNFGSGEGRFSEMFFQRMTQLALMSDSVEGGVINGASMVPIDKTDIDECTECLDYPVDPSVVADGIVPMDVTDIDGCTDCLDD